MLILGLLGMYFDAAVVFVTNSKLFFKLAVAILWDELKHIVIIQYLGYEYLEPPQTASKLYYLDFKFAVYLLLTNL